MRARVINEERGLYRVQFENNKILSATVSGKMQFNASDRLDFPAVGDWVDVEISEQADRAVIHFIHPRKSVIRRKQAGASSDVQVLATNVDCIFITTSLNEDLNYRRLERYLAVAWESGAMPVILLTKADLRQSDRELAVLDVEKSFPGVNVHAISKDEFHKADFFQDYLKEGMTSVVIGSSGVGKSTLVNYLIGDQRIKTQEVREDDDKGKHTTTSRSLYASRFGGLIIDTPGMRELQLSDHTDGVQAQFADIEQLMSSCRFTDCRHETEPGCVLREALENGQLDEGRWKNYLKMAAEVRHEMRKKDKSLLAEERKIWKKRNSEMRERQKEKKRGY